MKRRGVARLWYLHLCADAGVVVISYRDSPVGKMSESKNGSGKFVEVLLQPRITITQDSDLERAEKLHHKAHKMCFIANSVNFPIICQPLIEKID